jgi:hypothetical protein
MCRIEGDIWKALNERPRCRRAANKRDELTPSHVLSSSLFIASAHDFDRAEEVIE